MPLFTPSTVPWVSAVKQVADSAGASADDEMTTRAHYSLRAAFLHLNGRAQWNFLRAEAAPTSIVGPFSVTGVTASAAQVSAKVPSGHGILVDDIISGSGFGPMVRVTATASASFGFSVAISGFGAGDQTFDVTASRDSYALPTDWRGTYGIRFLGLQTMLMYQGRRMYDRTTPNEGTGGTPIGYDLYNSFGKGKIRILPPPASSDTMIHRYLRRMYVGTASSDTTALDIPEDYELYPIAWAKWHFLTDKSENRQAQATTWMSLAQEGIKTMLADQANLSDENLMFVPGYSVGIYPGGDNSTRYIGWDFT